MDLGLDNQLNVNSVLYLFDMVMRNPDCKLRESMYNFSVWKYLLTTILGALDLLHYVAPPEQGGAKPGAVAGGRRRVREEDKLVMAIINASLTYQVLALVDQCSTALQLWQALESRSSTLSVFKSTTTLRDFENAKKESVPMPNYLCNLLFIRDSLVSYGVRLTDEQLIEGALQGLPGEYDLLKKKIKNRSAQGGLSFDEVCDWLTREAKTMEEEGNGRNFI